MHIPFARPYRRLAPRKPLTRPSRALSLLLISNSADRNALQPVLTLESVVRESSRSEKHNVQQVMFGIRLLVVACHIAHPCRYGESAKCTYPSCIHASFRMPLSTLHNARPRQKSTRVSDGRFIACIALTVLSNSQSRHKSTRSRHWRLIACRSLTQASVLSLPSISGLAWHERTSTMLLSICLLHAEQCTDASQGHPEKEFEM